MSRRPQAQADQQCLNEAYWGLLQLGFKHWTFCSKPYLPDAAWVSVHHGWTVAVSYCSRIYADVLFALTRAAEPAIQPCEFHKQFPRKLVCRIISFMMYGSFGKEPFWQLPRIEKLFRILLPRDRIHGWELRSRMAFQKPMESRKLFLQVYPILSM